MRNACLAMLVASSLSCGPARAAGQAADRSRVPAWDARGLGALPPQGIACLDASADGRFVAVGTISPWGDPNVFLLDGDGRIVEQLCAGRRWIGEVRVADDGGSLAAVCTTPEGTAGDAPRLAVFRRGKELAQAGPRFRPRDLRAGAFLFHYGGHSNHLPPFTARAGNGLAAAGDDTLWWLAPEGDAAEPSPLGRGITTAFAACPAGRAAVGRAPDGERDAGDFRDLVVVERSRPKALWTRAAGAEAAPPTPPEKGLYGPATPPRRDVPFTAPLALAIDESGEKVAAADYPAWDRRLLPAGGGAERSYARRVMPARPAIHVHGADGRLLRRFGPESFREPFWCNLGFSRDGTKLLVSPHNWTSRGLAGQPILPADAGARDLYVLDVAGGGIETVRFPDAVSSADWTADGGIVAGCWDHRVYLLGPNRPPGAGLPKGLEVGAASLVRASLKGDRIAVATAAGAVLMLDSGGNSLWRTDLNQAARQGDKSWTKNQKAEPAGPGLWHTNGGLAHSDLGRQILIEAPEGLLLIDPNAGASFEQNWARIQGAGLDPMRIKYVLLTHEHGDHAPGAYLWRVATGARVVASAEMAYLLRHHIPSCSGYGFHPPNPVDLELTEDRDLDLAGLKVKAVRLPGHTYGSMGYLFEKGGRAYVATGDLIMPGGVLGYSGSADFSARDVLDSLRKLAALKPDVVLGGHGGGPPDNFIAKGIEAGEATGWSRMPPEKPDPFYRFARTDYLVAAWLQPILSAAYGDMDGDGRSDVAVLVPKGKGSAVRLHLNRGGKFAESPDAEIDLPDLDRGWKLRALRLGGGRDDLAVSSESQALILANQGRLEFRPVPVPGMTRASQFLTGDFNGDGRADLLIGSRFVSGFGIATRGEDGSFRARQVKAPAYFDAQIADVNGDGREDLILSNGAVFLREPGGPVAEAPAFQLKTPPGNQPGWTFMAAADFDRDGWTDVAFVANDKDGAAVWLYRNARNPQAPFTEAPSAAFTVPGALAPRDGPTVADFNGDGLPDLILGAGNKGGACILAGSAEDGLDARRKIAIPLDYEPHFDTRLGVADFNGDGRPDLAGFGPSAVGAVGVYILLQPPK